MLDNSQLAQGTQIGGVLADLVDNYDVLSMGSGSIDGGTYTKTEEGVTVSINMPDGTQEHYRIAHHEHDVAGAMSTGFGGIAAYQVDQAGNPVMENGQANVVFSFPGSEKDQVEDLHSNIESLNGNVWPQVANVEGFLSQAQSNMSANGVELQQSEITTFSHSASSSSAMELQRQFMEQGIDRDSSHNIAVEPMYLETYFENLGQEFTPEQMDYLREGHAINSIRDGKVSVFREGEGSIGILSNQHGVEFDSGASLGLMDMDRHKVDHILAEIREGGFVDAPDSIRMMSNEELTDGVASENVGREDMLRGMAVQQLNNQIGNLEQNPNWVAFADREGYDGNPPGSGQGGMMGMLSGLFGKDSPLGSMMQDNPLMGIVVMVGMALMGGGGLFNQQDTEAAERELAEGGNEGLLDNTVGELVGQNGQIGLLEQEVVSQLASGEITQEQADTFSDAIYEMKAELNENPELGNMSARELLTSNNPQTAGIEQSTEVSQDSPPAEPAEENTVPEGLAAAAGDNELAGIVAQLGGAIEGFQVKTAEADNEMKVASSETNTDAPSNDQGVGGPG